MAALRFLALLALVAAATAAFVPSPMPFSRPNTAMQAGFDLASLGTLGDPQVIGAVVAVAAATVAGTMVQGAQPEPVVVEDEEPEPEPIDVSIPYDAAARLAFEEADFDEEAYQEFKTIYENLASAEATVSRYQRELAALKK
ncbi:expressed unknown protein [Seminavis robusta]|uniref:Uncharacterized protein n=1 Tax=Seminavis robusta TaxID=568900 RepID=A0A9N8EPU1_9STRA|nr:expressed unknown protein [Seminavis robusta]|eukprot:Sro1512_g278810.1 n/a (142) ;mRNA; f:13145-13570